MKVEPKGFLTVWAPFFWAYCFFDYRNVFPPKPELSVLAVYISAIEKKQVPSA